MKQSSAQLALDDFLWTERPSPARQPAPLPKHPTCRLQRRLVYRYRVLSTTTPTPGLRLLPPLR